MHLEVSEGAEIELSEWVQGKELKGISESNKQPPMWKTWATPNSITCCLLALTKTVALEHAWLG